MRQKDIENIKEYIKNDFINFQKTFDESIKSDVSLINTVINYIVKRKGKQIRPTLCLLSANLCGTPNINTYVSASLLEILHIATLIHDDVVDESDLRRGWPSINRVWKNKIAILIGDFMFSKALSNMIKLKDFEALNVLSTTSDRLSRGELLQIEKAIKKDMTEKTYYKMVNDKTGSLFSASCKLGALSVTKDNSKIVALSNYGEKFGLIFQIKDDLLDILGDIDRLGKPAGYDLKKNMLTLPLIFILNKLEGKRRKLFKSQLRVSVKKNQLNKIKNIIIENGGIEYANNKIKEFKEDAIQELEIFDDSPIKESLVTVLEFSSSRNK